MDRHSKRSRRQFLHTVLTGAAALAVVPRVAAQGAVPQTKKPMKIGIIGSGRQGGALGILWAKAGHEIFFSSRNPDNLKDLVAKAGPKARAGSPADAAKFGEVIFVAVPYAALPQVGKDYAASMRGKVVIDCSNPYIRRDGDIAADAIKRGTGVASAEYLPGVRLVRALNAIGFRQVEEGAHRSGEKMGIPIAGDDAGAVAVAAQLVTDAGFDPVVVGGLARAKEFDPETPVYVKGFTARELREALKLPPK